MGRRADRLGAHALTLAVVASLATATGSGSARADTVSYRVNAGGPVLSTEPAWEADTAASPSPYVNAAETGNRTFSTTTAIDLSHPSVPPGTPQALFQAERWDPVEAPEMQWDFPVVAGSYEVRLYFAEIYSGAQAVGARVFDVTVEGTVVLDDYDVFADVGGYAAVVKSFVVSADSNLDVDLGHVVENPAIKGIEILPAERPNELGASPASVEVGQVPVGASASADVTLTNLGTSGDPEIVVDATDITGTHAADFVDDFDDSGQVTLAPGASTTLTVTFTPTDVGDRSATLEVHHSGLNTPLAVPLTGEGTGAGTWEARAPSGLARQEVSYVQVGGRFYLAGGGTAHQAYDPATDSWSDLAPLPADIDHIQGVTVAGLVYYVGGLAGWPGPHVNTVHVYDPATDSFSQATPMPEGRGRGAGGVAVHDGKIYYAGGLHDGVAVPWFDVYDPAAGTWTALPDMPRARDHFHAAVMNGTFYAIGGRDTAIDATTAANDAYAIATRNWSTDLAPLPTARGGFGAAVLGTEILVIGGEGGGRTHDTVEAYDTGTDSWRTLPPMPTPRHGIQAAECNGAIYVAAGGTVQGGSGPSDVHEMFLPSGATPCATATVGFGKSLLAGATSPRPTSLQFGPDGRLYVAHFNGTIAAHTVVRNGPNDYAATATETIGLVNDIPNHDDDGTPNTSITKRLITGMLVTGSAANPVIHVASSDPRIGGGGSTDNDLNLDTNSSMISRLTWDGTAWNRLDLVRGLPRSEENHATNGMVLDPATNTLFVAQGGNTNQGAPSNNFAYLPEFALSAAILSVDLDAVGNTTYDLPTLDDEDRLGDPDINDPFGGNDGKNQAKLVASGPVQVFAPGFRNPYDLVITTQGLMYTVDNGANGGWGDIPVNEGPGGTCTNDVNEPGTTDPDSLHLITGSGYYGGHPNPTRGNTANTFNASNPQSPVAADNAIECDYRAPGGTDSTALTTFDSSTNGISEYTASNFGGAMAGDLLAAGWNANAIYRIVLDNTGTVVESNDTLFSSVGSKPLDVIALGDSGPFPGTIWATDFGADAIVAFEPDDFDGGGSTCTGADDPTVDEDGDGYDNADEIDNGTDPCSAADVPPDWDGDLTSDLNDPDDDDDGQPDTSDPFALDPDNGITTNLPVSYTWENDAPDPGGILNLGFTGLMTNGTSDYTSLYDETKMTAGGAAGVLTVDEVSEGDALGSANTQHYAFQFGVDPLGSGPFTVRTRILAPFAGMVPEDFQSMGLVAGSGGQDDYVKIVTSANGGSGGVEFLKEVAGTVTTRPAAEVTLPGPDAVDLYLRIDPDAGTVQPSYAVTIDGATGPRTELGGPEAVPAGWFDGTSALAIGIISTSAGPSPEFAATWDLVEAIPDPPTLTVTSISPDTVPAGWTGEVTISGTGFEPGATVHFENGSGPTPQATDVAVVNGGTITATVVIKSGGPRRDRLWDVVVTAPDGATARLVDGFTVLS
ncbi:MAG: choice-of-anchor D domain-containing protein [Actinobacteria bacterium]|nr:choice-of-anchor D domain-containing protein [Actinomycetota bacterium]